MQRQSVLIVDDDDLNIEVMEAYLQHENYQLSSAHSGERALEKVASDPPDLLLLDVRMTGISGYETCKRLKANDATKHIPVLIVTGFQEKRDILEAIEAGADDLIFKPIKPPLMLLRVRRLLYQKHLYDQLNG